MAAVEAAIGPKWVAVWRSAARAGSLETAELIYGWAAAKHVGQALLGIPVDELEPPAAGDRPGGPGGWRGGGVSSRRAPAAEVAAARGHARLAEWLYARAA